jgi:DNA replication protein DnaC
MADDEKKEDDVQQGVIYGRQRRLLTEKDLVRMGLPRKLWNAKLEGIQDVRARKVVGSYMGRILDMMRTGSGLIVCGFEGVGKSGVAAVIAKEACRWGFSVQFSTHEDLQELRFENREFEGGLSLVERIRSADLLVLDNFNQDFLEDRVFGPARLEKLIARRVGNRLTTVLTTRLNFDELKNEDRMKRVYSVMKESMVGFRITGKDLREDLCSEVKDLVFGKPEDGSDRRD